MIVETLAGLGSFALYMCLSLVLLVIFKYAYSAVTPHNEWKLIREGNIAAGIAFGGAIIGFTIALAGAGSNSVNIADFLIWGVVALITQLIAFGLTRLSMSDIVQQIESGSIASAIILAAISVGVGLMNAACLTY